MAQVGSSALALGMALAAAFLLAHRGAAQASSSSCLAPMVSLSPCLSFTTGNTSTPSSSCCSALASVVQNTPRCLCTVLAGGASSLGVTVNSTRALQLPASCKVQTPPVSRCNDVGVPVPSPAAPSTTPPGGSASHSPPTTAAPGGSASHSPPTTAAPGGSASHSPPTTAVPAVPSTTGSGSKATPSTDTVSSDAGISKTATASVVLLVAVAQFAF